MLVLDDELIAAEGAPFGALLERAGVASVDASAADHGPLHCLGAAEFHPDARLIVVIGK